MNEFTKVIEAHLKGVAAQDSQFAEKFEAKMKSDKNSIVHCCSYIITEVKKSGRQAFHDDEIYGMAIHFFDEGLNYQAAAPKCKIVCPAKSAGARKAKKPVVQDEVQLSLF